ncbi:MAG: PAS-domain containing protein, partial [Rhodospirillales bacterium]
MSRRGFVIDWDGEPAICSVCVDISEQKTIEARIQARQKIVEQKHNKLHEAINSFKAGFALFGADDKLEKCNQSYINNLDNISDIIKPGISFEESLRARIERNQRQDGILRNEAFIQKRLERHINPKDHFERTFSDGKTYQICEFKTQSGGVVIFRIDVTEQKKSEQELQ